MNEITVQELRVALFAMPGSMTVAELRRALFEIENQDMPVREVRLSAKGSA